MQHDPTDNLSADEIRALMIPVCQGCEGDLREGDHSECLRTVAEVVEAEEPQDEEPTLTGRLWKLYTTGRADRYNVGSYAIIKPGGQPDIRHGDVTCVRCQSTYCDHLVANDAPYYNTAPSLDDASLIIRAIDAIAQWGERMDREGYDDSQPCEQALYDVLQDLRQDPA